MTDQEIEQERQKIDTPPEPLYVDGKANERNYATMFELHKQGMFAGMDLETFKSLMDEWEYDGDGSIVRPFLTLAEARDAQQPGQDIVIAGYGRIGRAYAAKPDSVENDF